GRCRDGETREQAATRDAAAAGRVSIVCAEIGKRTPRKKFHRAVLRCHTLALQESRRVQPMRQRLRSLSNAAGDGSRAASKRPRGEASRLKLCAPLRCFAAGTLRRAFLTWLSPGGGLDQRRVKSE